MVYNFFSFFQRFAAQIVKTEADVSGLILAHAQLVGQAAHVMLVRNLFYIIVLVMIA